MSKTEDYLDGLLNSLEGKGQNQEVVDAGEVSLAELPLEETALEPESMDADMEFLDSFEREFLSGEDTDAFIRQFERELAEEEGAPLPDIDRLLSEDETPDDFTVDNLETGDMTPSDDSRQEDDALDDFMVDTLGDFTQDLDEPLPGLENVAAIREEGLDSLKNSDEQELMDLLHSEGDFSGMGDTLGADESILDNTENLADGLDGFTLEEIPVDDTMIAEESAEESAKENEPENKAASGFLKKVSQVLFGEEEEQIPAASELMQEQETAAEKPDIGNLSEDELLLMELEGAGTVPETESEEEVPETEEEAKERKKREKEEKKEKNKAKRAEKRAQKKAKQAEKKAQKVKKPKKPKEPDNTPPLPKKPVILCFAMAASFLVLVLLGTEYFGYSSSMSNASKQFGLGNYEEAYQQVSGLDIREKDYDTYGRYRVMGTVAGEYNSYQTFMDASLYDMALDSLVRAVGRCQKYASEAEQYGCTGELEKIHVQAAGALAGFGITEEQALELYAVEGREEYSVQINTILEAAGYVTD